MNRLLFRSSLRYQRRHPWLLLLSVVGVATGVAVVVGVELANSSATRAFTLSADAVAGRATHRITGPAGDLDEHLYPAVRRLVPDASPVVEGYVRSTAGSLRLLGIDPLVDGRARPEGAAVSFPSPAQLMTRPGAVAVSADLAARLGADADGAFTVSAGGRDARLHIVGTVTPPSDADRQGWSDLLVADIATAQEVLGLTGRLTRIDAVLSTDEAGIVASALPVDARLESAAGRSETLAQMTRAFELNLTALGYLALVVGMFLIYNVVTFSVVQRRAVFGRLRAVGTPRRALMRLIITEAALLGVAGTAVGIVFGLVLGSGLVRLVTRAINDLYFVVSVRELALSWPLFGKAVFVGIVSTVVAAWIPARSAAGTAPSAVMRRSEEEDRLRRRFPALLAGAAVSGLAAGLVLWLDSGIVGGYAGLLLMLVAFALAAPATVSAAATAGLAVTRGTVLRMALSGIRTQISRTSVATAALAVAIAAAIGVGVMVQSFRGTVDTWLNTALRADVYVQPPGTVVRRGGEAMEPAALAWLRAHPAVQSSFGVRRVEVASEVGPVDLVAVEHGPETHDTFRFRDLVVADPWQAMDSGRDVVVSEPFAYRYGVQPGDSLALSTTAGTRRMRVAGLYLDYGSDLGAVLIGRPAFDRMYADGRYSGLALYLRDGVDREEAVLALRAGLPGNQTLLIQSSASLRDASLEIFDRTFAVTWVLRALAVVVAVIGIVSALAALQIERAWEFGVLQAIGFQRRQLGRLIRVQSAVMGLIAGLMALPLGLLLAAGLVFVINRRSFGWTLQFDVSPSILVQAVLVSVVAALAASYLPARSIASGRLVDRLRARHG